MFFQHVYDKSLAQASYVIGCQKTGEAIVIDAKRDIDTYLDIANQNNLKITHVTETHIHADFLAGTREIAAVTGAKMYLSDEGGPDWSYEFDHIGLKDGDNIKVGNLNLEVIHTPGHTPESISFLLTDNPATREPVMLFTGDFVFVGDIGRPDLLEKAAGLKGTQDKGAEDMYKSIKKFSNLPPYLQVWPGHGAGSACGKALGAVPSTTVGYELIRNWAFQYEDNKKGFVDYLLEGQPEPPKYFAMMKKLNKVDRPLLTAVPKHKKLSPAEFKVAYDKGVKVIDARDKAKFAEGHIPNTIHIQGNNSFSTWAGWVLNYEELHYQNRYVQPDENGQVLSSQLGWKNDKLNLAFAYTHAFDSGRFLFPKELGRDHFFTSISRSRLEGLGNVNVYTLKGEYLPVPQLHLGVELQQIKGADANVFQFNKYNVDESFQLNTHIRYEVHGFLEGLSFDLLWVYRENHNHLDAQSVFNKSNFNQLNFVTNFYF